MLSALWLVGCCLSPLAAAERAVVHHDLQVVVQPGDARIEVVDKITLPQRFKAGQDLAFSLHRGLVIEGEVGSDQKQFDETQFAVPVSHYQVTPAGREVTLRYSGRIFHDITQYGHDFAATVESSAGMISPQGVFLAGSSAWYPITEATDVSFSLSVKLPDGWHSVSQGGRTVNEGVTTWSEARPQQEIYLLAAPFAEYTQTAGNVEAMVFLRQPDDELAQRYLELTGQYIQTYTDLIGPYPYAKFALVENFWESGFGMPSFTLLGPSVIRLPFIPYTSYPHEILHNWWGNGVYVDYEHGNWSEGLTSYLADHLLKEMRGGAADYRRAALQGYANYVGEHKDFPLTEFRFRHGSSSQAIGYGKGMMLFHMLRRQVGDEAFKKMLQQFYADYAFKEAGYAEWQKVTEQVVGQSFQHFFDQWTTRTGAPELAVADVTVAALSEADGGGWLLRGQLRQHQGGSAYELQVPLYVSVEGEAEAQLFNVFMTEKQQPFELRFAAKPLRLDVDPNYDLFRQIAQSEIPAALSQAFAADKVLVVLPANANDALRLSYQRVAQHWERGYREGGEIVLDEELAALPADRAVWLLGRENRFVQQLPELQDRLHIEEGVAQLFDQSYPLSDYSLVLTAKNPQAPKQGIVWLINERPDAVLGLLRKLPHYGKYSYLAFEGDEPTNQLKGQWPVTNSPLAVVLPGGEALEPVIPRLAPLVE